MTRMGGERLVSDLADSATPALVKNRTSCFAVDPRETLALQAFFVLDAMLRLSAFSWLGLRWGHTVRLHGGGGVASDTKHRASIELGIFCKTELRNRFNC